MNGRSILIFIIVISYGYKLDRINHQVINNNNNKS
jgi:hypothetical protein